MRDPVLVRKCSKAIDAVYPLPFGRGGGWGARDATSPSVFVVPRGGTEAWSSDTRFALRWARESLFSDKI